MPGDNPEVRDQNEVGWQNELEQRFIKIQQELNELSNSNAADDSVEVAEWVLDWKFAEFLLDYNNGVLFNQLKKIVDRLRGWDLSNLSTNAWKWLDQLAKFLDDIWNSERMQKDYTEFMDKIKDPKKLSTMQSPEIRRLNLYLWMHEDNALTAYKEMKNIFGKFAEKWMTGQDITFFNDVWNTLKSGYSASDKFIAEDYWKLSEVSNLKEFTDKLWDFFPNGKWFWKWDGRNLLEQWLPDKDNSIVSKSKVIEKFNSLNDIRTKNNKDKVSNIAVNTETELSKFTKKDGKLLYNWEEFTVAKMEEVFWEQIKKLAWEWTEFVSDDEMNQTINECKDGIFTKIESTILPQLQEEVTDSNDDIVPADFEASKDSFKANQNLKDKIKELGFYDWNEEWENIKFNITKVREYLDTLKDQSWQNLKNLGALEKQTWIISVQIALNCLNSKDWNYKDSCNVEWLDGIYKDRTANWVEWFQNKYNEGKSDNEKLKPDKLPWPKTITAIIAELSKLMGDNNTGVESSEDGDEELKEPEISWNWELWDIKEDWEKKTGTDGLFNWLTREQQEGLDADKDLFKTIENIKTQLQGVKNLLSNEKLGSNGSLKKLLEWLPKVLTAIDYPTKDNVKCLQKFISDNLVDKPDEKALFDQLNKKAAGFDGNFWKGTLKWVNILLEKTWKYVNDMKEYLDKLILRDDVKIKSEVTVEKWWALEQSAFIVDGSSLPDGVNLNFEPKLEDVKTDDTVDCNIKVTATKNHEGGEIKREMGNVTVKVVDSTDNQPVTTDILTETTTEPLNLEWGQHLVMGNSLTLADNIGLPGRAVFYSADVKNPPIEAQDGKWWTWEVPKDIDYNCILQVDWQPDKTYWVKVDKDWNLCPVAINQSSKVRVVFENNRSCIKYLENKLPNELKGKNVDIWRRGSDYVIWLWKWEYLTIEPMSIDNKWVWKDLTENLAFLNLTNYLRNERELQDVEFINDNPNLKLEWNELYVRVKKNSNVTYDENWAIVKMWKWLRVDKKTFWLQHASPESLNNYIKYNNNERWNRNWDNNEQNKYYRTVRLSA